jgi:dimethylamine monooxygenase subunit C
MVNLADTSIPSWALGMDEPALDAAGAAYVFIGVGSAAAPILQKWCDDIADRSVECWVGEGVQSACAVLVEALARARVGVRVAVAGPAGACLALRAAALDLGLEDDEFVAVTAGAGQLEVFCTHCRATTSAAADVGDAVVCSDCQRNLVVYHHVSRLSGRFMGYIGDAEVMVP